MKVRVLGDVHDVETGDITFKKDEILTIIDWKKDKTKEGYNFKKGLWFVFEENPSLITHQEWFQLVDNKMDHLDVVIELKRIKEQNEGK
jgi:hypothetical protein